MNLDFKVMHKYTKENYPVLEHLPYNPDIKYDSLKTAKALAKNYRYKSVKLFKGTIESLRKVLDFNELYIIKDSENNIVDWHYRYKATKDVSLLGISIGETLKNMHKGSNASPKVKLARSIGSQRVQAFKVKSMGIKIKNWSNESKQYNKHM